MITENKILTIANMTGKIALQSGAETYRVENIISKICENYNLRAQCFVSLTCIITSVRNHEGEIFSSVERITSRTINLNKVHSINQLVRDVKNYNFDEFTEEVIKMNRGDSYSKLVYLLSYCLAAFFFALLYKGGLNDGIVAFLGGGVVFLISDFAAKVKTNTFFLNTISGSICTLSSYVGVKLGIIESVSYSTIGVIMLLVPGIALTNAIRDLVAGDLVAGISRAVEAFLVGAALVSGTGFALFLILKLGEV